jgi:hypothetical protein
MWISFQMHGLPWNRKTTFHLRAYGDIIDVLSEGIGKKPVQLMTAVITDILTKQTGADSQSDLFYCCLPIWRIIITVTSFKKNDKGRK